MKTLFTTLLIAFSIFTFAQRPVITWQTPNYQFKIPPQDICIEFTVNDFGQKLKNVELTEILWDGSSSVIYSNTANTAPHSKCSDEGSTEELQERHYWLFP